jgi:hypothetical protein
MKGWFCSSCKSLNSRGAKRCYSCGVKQDFLPVGDALVPKQPAPTPSAATGGAVAGGPSMVVSSATGAPAGPFAAASSAAAAGLEFGGASRRRRRRPKRARVLLVLALTLVVAGVTAAGVMTSPEWLRAAPNKATPAASHPR